MLSSLVRIATASSLSWMSTPFICQRKKENETELMSENVLPFTAGLDSLKSENGSLKVKKLALD